MTTSAVSAMVNAVFALLKADAGVTAALGGPGKVFDVVPGALGERVTMPWVYLGPVGTKRIENDGFRLWEIRLRIFCATTDFARDQAWTIAEAIDLALDTRELAIDQASGFGASGPLRMMESGDIIDPTRPQSVFTDVVGTVGRLQPLFAGVDG